MILIDAVFIHTGGGKTLLEYLIDNLFARDKKFYLLLDNRVGKLNRDYLNVFNSINIENSEIKRIQFYRKMDLNISVVFCFANVPPPSLKRNVKVFVFFQNINISSNFMDNNGLSYKSKFINLLRKYYIRFLNKESYTWIVQTERVKYLVQTHFKIVQSKIEILPFFTLPMKLDLEPKKRIYDFIYVADGIDSKNHIILLKGLERLFVEGLNPSLVLTVPPIFLELNQNIERLKEKGVKIFNFGYCDFKRVWELYHESICLVYPSLSESFGLPLLEATHSGCKVLAINLPYVRSVIVPSRYFNPNDLESLVDGMKFIFQGENLPVPKRLVENQIEILINLIYSNE